MALLALPALPVLRGMMGGRVPLVLLLQSIPFLIQVPMNQSSLASIDIPTMSTSIPLTNKSPNAFTLRRIVAHIAPSTSTISTLMMSFVNMTSSIAFLITSVPALMTNIHLIMSILLSMRIIAANLTTLILVLIMITLLPMMGILAQPMMMSLIGIVTPTIVSKMMILGLTTMELANRETSSNFRIQSRLTSLVCSSLIGVRSFPCLMGQRSMPYM
ncbi:hypothetical protein V8E52_006875 [Russula decolorans]